MNPKIKIKTDNPGDEIPEGYTDATYYVRRGNGERYGIGGAIHPYPSRSRAQEVLERALGGDGEIEVDFE